MEQDNICVVGARQKIMDAKEIFMHTENLV